MVKYYYCTYIGTNPHRVVSQEENRGKPTPALFGLEIEATDAQFSLTARMEPVFQEEG